MATSTRALAASLRFAGGTLHVKLSQDTSLDILVDKDVIKDACPVLAPSLRSPDDSGYLAAFDNSVELSIPGLPLRARIYTLALKFVDGTMVLEGDTFRPMGEGEACFTFDHSTLSSDWPDHVMPYAMGCDQRPEEKAAHQYIVIFKILHGLPIRVEDICDPQVRSSNRTADIEVSVEYLSELCSRAEYLGCLAPVSQAICNLLFPIDGFWKAVADDASRYVLLAVKLRSTELYFEALRHLITLPHKTPDDFSILADALELRKEDVDASNIVQYEERVVREHIDCLLEAQASTMNAIRRGLLRQQLFQTWSTAWGDGGEDINHTTYLDKTQHDGMPQCVDEKAAHLAEFMARGQWSQFLAQHEVGDFIVMDEQTTKSGKSEQVRRGYPGGPLSRGIRRIEESVQSGDPASLFGKNAAQKLTDMTSLDEDVLESASNRLKRKASLVKSIHLQLRDIVVKAYSVIQKELATRQGSVDNLPSLTYRRCRYEATDGHLTYLGLDETNVPWDADDLKWRDALDRQAESTVDTTAALKHQLETLGIRSDTYTEDGTDPRVGLDEVKRKIRFGPMPTVASGTW